jgi:LytS/YehU family sensor histidine kinase
MKNKLIKLALITSPILSIYGVAPVLLYKSMGLAEISIGFLSLTVLILSSWLYNIYLAKKVNRIFKRYLLSYAITLFFNSIVVFIPFYIMPDFLGKEVGLNFLFYALTATMSINTIILIVINAELLKLKKDIAETENQKLKVVNLEAQKQVLMQQLQPHFLFNALSTLKSLIHENAEQAEDYSVKLSEFLRYSVEAYSKELVTLEEELQFTNDYLELQKARFGIAFHCEIQIEESALKLKLPVFALQTLVENALKHNAFTEKKSLIIDVTTENNLLKVSNNKIPKALIHTSGTGLKNLNERYKLTSGKAIEIANSENVFTVTINLL